MNGGIPEFVAHGLMERKSILRKFVKNVNNDKKK
jgi:hypothetical protein